MVRGGPAGGTWETLAAGRNEGENLVPLSFPGTFTHPVVESGWKWYIVGQSGRKWGKRGEAKTSRHHPGWFFAPTEGLGLPTKSTWASLQVNLAHIVSY